MYFTDFSVFLKKIDKLEYTLWFSLTQGPLNRNCILEGVRPLLCVLPRLCTPLVACEDVPLAQGLACLFPEADYSFLDPSGPLPLVPGE